MAEMPKIEFPQSDYPIKVIAEFHETLRGQIVDIMRRHDGSFLEEAVEVVESSRGNYCSVRVSILATGEEQLQALHQELLEHPLVKLVL